MNDNDKREQECHESVAQIIYEAMSGPFGDWERADKPRFRRLARAAIKEVQK